MTINEKIKTVLTYKEVAHIAVCIGIYNETIKGRKGTEELIKTGTVISDRIMSEIYAYPKSNFTK